MNEQFYWRVLFFVDLFVDIFCDKTNTCGSSNEIEFSIVLLSFFNVQIDAESAEFRQPRRNRKRDLLKRVMSSSHQRSNTSEADSQGNSPVKSTVSENFMHVTDKMFCDEVEHKTFSH